MFEEKPIRAIVKAVSWRLGGGVITFIGLYLISGDLNKTVSIGLGVESVKIVIYYLHERVWNKIQFGRKKQQSPEYTI